MFSISRIPLASAVAGLTLLLSACSETDDPAPAETSAAPAEIAIANARVVLPAVGGNPAAAYFDLTNSTATVAVLTGVEVAQAERTELHETTGTSMARLPEVAIQPGEQAVFAPGGKHAMVFGPPAVPAGTTLTMTFRFEDGRQETAEAAVRAAGGDGADAIDHSGAAH